MNDTPELDQVAEARRKLSVHAELPRTYWVLYGIALVLMAGIPIWASYLPGGLPDIQWALLAVTLAAAAYAVISRRRSGVYLPRRISAYPGARRLWVAVLAVSAAGIAGIYLLVGNGLRPAALVLLAVVAVVVFLGQVRIRARMRDDIAAGRVTP
ncbi:MULTISPECIES: hypothetical protein [Pseudonocardia]|uniref:Transmembrane protein n=2 Tax=Pseudonocardia TaxID=1847 RepID=A0A1Y2MWK1_PSEAH|nr:MULTISPECIES: hypothetical protein [Pseudonocardia]OSY39511.1 hypothetical protein BG845_03458 [Pseudonocardia autotrophica]TDN75251.1 hypothetical protein C8E95_4397 [Pseudonocardia autotrophica]BBF99196.1 hypothetical protein Pdca_04060 [Pseudonocardia autotrophica]GEC24742.1 hypothetical protein PSA01_17710 [Pseudonocardia saturnea]